MFTETNPTATPRRRTVRRTVPLLTLTQPEQSRGHGTGLSSPVSALLSAYMRLDVKKSPNKTRGERDLSWLSRASKILNRENYFWVVFNGPHPTYGVHICPLGQTVPKVLQNSLAYHLANPFSWRMRRCCTKSVPIPCAPGPWPNLKNALPNGSLCGRNTPNWGPSGIPSSVRSIRSSTSI